MPVLRFTGGIAMLAAACCACGVAFNSPADEVPPSSEPTVLTFVDPAVVPGLQVQTIIKKTGKANSYLTYPQIPGATPLSERMRAELVAEAKAFNEKNAKGKATLPKSEINVDWQLTAVSPKVTGVRLRTGRFEGESWINSTRTLWYDGARVVTSDLLVKNLNDLARVVGTRLADDTDVHLGAIKPDRALFDSLDFNSRGDLVVEFDDYEIGPGAMGRVATAIPRQEAAPLLSDFGKAAQQAVESARPTTPPELRNPPEATAPAVPGKVDCRVARCVALTFDEGPGPYTDRILTALGTTRATFFLTGTNAAARPDLLRRMARDGHLVGNHGWSHRDLTTLPDNRIYEQLARTQDVIAQSTGSLPALMRPPYGASNPDVAKIAGELKLSLVTWDVDAGDDGDATAQEICRRVTSAVKPGSIVLLHDLGPATPEAIPLILKALEDRGYSFVTVPELYGTRPMQPGRTYESAVDVAVSRYGRPLP
ncbi:polysaccharide deacetylase family protein [Herbidospora galbida]|uniref:Polysaccharide deacetylase family protein n=1 Tax=Herbidospora galbida TaxID=2575442 RepID=A0A4U3ME72_9ACTN|nr:polysaccharide deacetylase family protein [Herbidospora galbida]TKK86799.1 polysaccharide deacetylase family protein [Herbidospora galbida]